MNAYFNEVRVKILKNSIKEHGKEFGVLEDKTSELNERYFLARRTGGKEDVKAPA